MAQVLAVTSASNPPQAQPQAQSSSSDSLRNNNKMDVRYRQPKPETETITETAMEKNARFEDSGRPRHKSHVSDRGITSLDESTTLRGKRLLRERLKQRARTDQRLRQERNSDDSLKIKTTDSTCAAVDTLGIITKNPDCDGNSTPSTASTAASTRSPSTISSNLRDTMSGLTLADSYSPTSESASASAISTKRHQEQTNSSFGCSPRTNMESPRQQCSVSSPTSSAKPNSRLSSEFKSIHPPPPPPRRSLNTAANHDWDMSKVPSPASATMKTTTSPATTGMSQKSAVSRRSTSTTTTGSSTSSNHNSTYRQNSHPESDEERETADKRSTQRGSFGRSAAVSSSDRRQQHHASSKHRNTERSNRIKLHVYDLIAEETIMQLPWGCHFPIGSCFNVLNSGLHTLGTGAYHVGIEINGVEYAYGANDTKGLTGVFTCIPKNSPGYQYRTTIDFGDRALIRNVHHDSSNSSSNNNSNTHTNRDNSTQQKPTTGTRFVDGREVVREMAAEYKGAEYDLLRKNCVTFAHDACVRLGVKDGEVPEWFRNLCLAGAAAQDAAHSTMEPISKVFSSCDMEGLSTELV